jgi:hypothetical protein
MRLVPPAIVIVVVMLGARLPPTFAGSAQTLPLTIRIHDYSRVPGGSLSQARAVVTGIYERIGVRTDWLGVENGEDLLAGRLRHAETPRPPLAQVTIIILTPKMAARAGVADDVLGYAAVPAEGMGRIAFAIYERVRSMAMRIPVNEADLLGFVMAHEVGHLVSGGSLGETGPMKNHWNVRDFQRIDLRALEFSEQQARAIRGTIENDGR